MSDDWHAVEARFVCGEQNALATLGLLRWCARVEQAAVGLAAEPTGEEMAPETLVLAMLGAISLGRTLRAHLADGSPPPAAPAAPWPSGILR